MKTIAWTARTARGLLVFSLAASAALGLSPNAVAQQPMPRALARCPDGRTPQDPEAARVSFRAGQTAFSEGAYARSVELWEQAYRDDCTAHALLLNLAMAQELLGRPRDAVRTLQLFGSRSPASPYVEANAKRIQRLERTADELDQERSRRVAPMSVQAPSSELRDAALLPSLPLAVSVAGGVVAVVGAVLFFEGRASASSAEERCGAARDACASSEGLVDGERARARAQVGGWMAGAGVAALAGGVAWHLLTRPSRPLDLSTPSRGVAFGADLPTRSARLTWAGSF